MPGDTTAAKIRAEARFNKVPDRGAQGAHGLSDQAAQVRALREKTARLKALRLAKEAADLEAAPAPVPKKTAAKAPSRAKKR